MPNRMKIPGYWIADYEERRPEGIPDQIILLLHGYSESGGGIFKKLEPLLPEKALVIAPNGPFPIPQRTPEGYRMGYSWYFYNPATDEYVFDMDTGIRFLRGLLEQLKLPNLPVRLIGFSQGGYLAPFVARALPQAKQVIGIGCEFLADELAVVDRELAAHIQSTVRRLRLRLGRDIAAG